MNRRLKSIVREEIRTEKQIADLQEHLKEVRIRRKQIEDDAILRSIRGMKLDRNSLLKLLDGIQAGTVTIQPDYGDDPDDSEGEYIDDAAASEPDSSDTDVTDEISEETATADDSNISLALREAFMDTDPDNSENSYDRRGDDAE